MKKTVFLVTRQLVSKNSYYKTYTKTDLQGGGIKMKKKDLKNLVKSGVAVDITTAAEWPQGLERIATSNGVYGLNGALYKDKQGQLYAVTARTANLFAI